MLSRVSSFGPGRLRLWLAGALSLLFVYPLDFARTLLAIDTHGASELPDHTIWLLAGMISVTPCTYCE